jgi:Ulp1 family protease
MVSLSICLEKSIWFADQVFSSLQRISRQDKLDTHVFSTHFYSTLEEDGPRAVTKWTKNKSIDVFTKRLIFIPINKHLHWSLCVVVNPGQILSHMRKREVVAKGVHDLELNGDNDEMPFILFLDSLNMHRKEQVAKNIRSWLNSEWSRLKKSDDVREPFTKDSMVVYSPQGSLCHMSLRIYCYTVAHLHFAY